MPKNPPDERLVYLALKHTFQGANAEIRRRKKIRELILSRQKKIDVQELIREHNIDNVCCVAKTLLEQQIFKSVVYAKSRFPEVFEVSPAQCAERSASEEEAARTEADAITAASGAQPSGVLPDREFDATISHETEQVTSQASKRSFPHATIEVPSLYPVYLPYLTQHRLLVRVQSLLESICYDFGKTHLPHIVEQKGWECAESAELNMWVHIFLSNQILFSPEQLESLGKTLADLLSSIAQLRHTAVHRLRITSARLEELMVDAEALGQLLCDDGRQQALGRLRRELQMTTGELKCNKDLLESRLNSKLKKIADQRAELDRLERKAVEEMLKEDRECQILAGANLDRAIQYPETIVHSSAPTDADSRTEPDLDTDLEADLETPVTDLVCGD